MRLQEQYHWAPTSVRVAVARQGLRPYCRSVNPLWKRAEEYVHVAYPYVCLSPDPMSAWALSGDQVSRTEVESWDLWQVLLEDGDEIELMPQWGANIAEVRVRNAIPGDRVRYVATREPPAAEETPA